MTYWDLKQEAEFELVAIVAIFGSLWLGFWIGELQKKRGMGKRDENRRG